MQHAWPITLPHIPPLTATFPAWQSSVGPGAVVTLVLVLIVPVWVLLSQAASKNFYFALAGAASVLSGRRWLIVLGLPGVLAGGGFCSRRPLTGQHCSIFW